MLFRKKTLLPEVVFLEIGLNPQKAQWGPKHTCIPNLKQIGPKTGATTPEHQFYFFTKNAITGSRFFEISQNPQKTQWDPKLYPKVHLHTKFEANRSINVRDRIFKKCFFAKNAIAGSSFLEIGLSPQKAQWEPKPHVHTKFEANRAKNIGATAPERQFYFFA